jgi:glycerol-3-phosphate acyltransferase PlsY
MMGAWIAILAGIVGYLFGSLSFARIIAHWFAPGADITMIRKPIANTDIIFESDSVSASVMRTNVGTRYGCLTAILDMLKVALPTLAFKIWQPETPYFLIVVVGGLVGHDWPLYHHFKGGRGESPIVGGVLVIDWLGLVIPNLAGILIGWLAGDILVLRWSWLILLIPWFWLRTHDPVYILFAVTCNLIYWGKTFPELKQFYQILRVLRKGTKRTQEQVAIDMAMGRRLGRFMDQYGAPRLVSRLLQGRKAKPGA